MLKLIQTSSQTTSGDLNYQQLSRLCIKSAQICGTLCSSIPNAKKVNSLLKIFLYIGPVLDCQKTSWVGSVGRRSNGDGTPSHLGLGEVYPENFHVVDMKTAHFSWVLATIFPVVVNLNTVHCILYRVGLLAN